MSRTVKDNRYSVDKPAEKKRAQNHRKQRLLEQEQEAQASFYTSKEIARLTSRGRS